VYNLPVSGGTSGGPYKMRTPILILLCLSLLTPCTARAACGPNIPGNLTGDCRVNFDDFAILAPDWLIPPSNDCPPNYPPGDLNLDCSVNSLDLDQMAFHWLQSCMGQIPTDLSGDCKVNLNDFAIMSSDWLTPAVPHEWVARYNGPGNDDDWPQAVAIDSNDNIYVTGYSIGSDTQRDYATIKYSPDSNQPVWLARYNGPVNRRDAASTIAVDSNDNIYVTGYSTGSGTAYDFATIKYSPDSNQPVWIARYNSSSNDLGSDIAIDSNDNIYVTGLSWGPGTYEDFATIKYSPDSNQPVWVARYDGPHFSDGARAIAVDSNDNIYVTGSSASSLAYNYSDWTTVKYAPDSNQPVWVARYDGPGKRDDHALAIIVDRNDNIYVTGPSSGLGTGWDYATIKYSPDSNEAVWVARYNGSGNGGDWAKAIAVDNNDNIYVTGHSDDSDTDNDYATIKYSPDSNQPVWIARYNGPVNYIDDAHALAVDSKDNIYVTGYSTGSGTDDDYATIKYSPDYACTPQVTGDFDLDCDVDIYDLDIFCQSWLDCNLDPPQDCWQ
jgi:uncharacterized delta-60 repeat protein